jgi:hypothetical protein
VTTATILEGGRVAATLALAVACAGAAVAVTGPGCTLRCDGNSVAYDGTAGTSDAGANMDPPAGSGAVDETTWESGPIDGTWVDFPGQRTMLLFPNLGQTFPGPYTSVEVYVSASPQANAPGNNWTLATGNLAEVSVQGPDTGTPWGVFVKNDTCAPYYARVVVRRAGTSAGGALDAGAD